MRFLLAAAAAAVLLAAPALAGGDWDYDDGDFRDYGYYEGPYEYYAGFYPPRWAAPIYAPPGAYPYRQPYPAYGYGAYAPRGYAYENDGDCVVKRKWRRGRYVEKIDCDD
jgi:hypothetical protein